jgi:outer membrane protein OmpA-like peptidoglycan-associated protein
VSADRRFPTLLLLAVLLAVPGVLRGQEAPPGYEQGIYEASIPGLAPAPVAALLDEHGGLLLPLTPVLELTGSPFTVWADSGRASVARPRGSGTATLDLRTGVLAADSTVRLLPGEAVAWRGDIYLAAARVGTLLEARVEVSQADLTVTLSRPLRFPAQERLDAQERRALARLTSMMPMAVDARAVPFVARSGGAVVEWGLSSSLPGLYRPDAVHLGAGLALWGGDLQVSTSFSGLGQDGASSTALSGRYRRVFPLSRWVRQVQLGDVNADNIRVQSMRGFSISNAPFIRATDFGEVPFRMQLPPGWEYEVYQGGRLLGFSQGSAGDVSIPLGYGSTPVHVRLLGPAGERVESDLVYIVPVVQLPAGRWEYTAGAGRCLQRQECRWLGFGDLRHGLTRSVTLFGGVNARSDSTLQALPYGGASFILGQSWSADVEGMYRSFLQASVQNTGGGPVTGHLEAGLTFTELRNLAIVGGGFPTLPTPSARWHVDALAAIRGGAGSTFRSVGVTGRVEGTREDGVDRARVTAQAPIRTLITEAGVEYNASPLFGEGTLGLLRVTTPLATTWRWATAPVVSAEVAGGAGGLQRAEVSAYTQVGMLALNLSARRDLAVNASSLVLTTSARLPYARTQARLGRQGESTVASASADGTFSTGRCTGVHPLAFGGLGFAGISGYVYHDLNGNGRLDSGEDGVPGAAVQVSGQRVRTDSTGRYATWMVLPYEIARVGVDTVTLEDASWMPMDAERYLRPAAHMYSWVNIPLLKTRQVSGQLSAGPGVPGVGGLTVEVVDTRTGDVQRVVTFSDGGFYVPRLRPGSYEVRLAESSLRALQAHAAGGALRLEVPESAAGEELLDLPRIQVEKGYTPASVPGDSAVRRTVPRHTPPVVADPGCPEQAPSPRPAPPAAPSPASPRPASPVSPAPVAEPVPAPVVPPLPAPPAAPTHASGPPPAVSAAPAPRPAPDGTSPGVPPSARLRGRVVTDSADPAVDTAQAGPGEAEGTTLVELGRVYFEFDRSILRKAATVTLDSLVRILEAQPALHVAVDGHADATGNRAYNMALAARRGRTVKWYLTRHGVEAARLTCRTFGEAQPVASNRTREGRRLNRRAEIVGNPDVRTGRLREGCLVVTTLGRGAHPPG